MVIRYRQGKTNFMRLTGRRQLATNEPRARCVSLVMPAQAGIVLIAETERIDNFVIPDVPSRGR